jgi:fumarylacetoacetase
VQDPEPLPYLKSSQPMNYDIHLEVVLQTTTGTENVICRSNTKYLYWNMSQQLAHHTVNGCNIRCGDVMASGTISGPDAGSYGSMLELAWRGTKPIVLSNVESRSFIQDGDTLTIRGFAASGNNKLGFGEVKGTVLPAE